ncbi:hypothetical protein TUBRATIS_005480 [Tubulinosema ratisbonensis]|uniref:Uncharacterized protein n=1 Tax=Tubulinosema ratisbonensis TaxID=291195 RepID=A0A437ANY9_9MICR|nr:hypothetical protein TUBRATIS_005480 [Tubulinosema ratisbonensis]
MILFFWILRVESADKWIISWCFDFVKKQNYGYLIGYEYLRGANFLLRRILDSPLEWSTRMNKDDNIKKTFSFDINYLITKKEKLEKLLMILERILENFQEFKASLFEPNNRLDDMVTDLKKKLHCDYELIRKFFKTLKDNILQNMIKNIFDFFWTAYCISDNPIDAEKGLYYCLQQLEIFLNDYNIIQSFQSTTYPCCVNPSYMRKK